MPRHQTNHNFLSKLLTFYCFEVVLINLMNYVKGQGEGPDFHAKILLFFRYILIIILYTKIHKRHANDDSISSRDFKIFPRKIFIIFYNELTTTYRTFFFCRSILNTIFPFSLFYLRTRFFTCRKTLHIFENGAIFYNLFVVIYYLFWQLIFQK